MSPCFASTLLVVLFIASSTLMVTPESRGDVYILSVGLDGPDHHYAHDINAQAAGIFVAALFLAKANK
jgi:hypothetical protein